MSKLTSAIPLTTSPLTKLIRTTEGWLVVGSNGLLVILGSVQDMPWTKVGTAAAVLNGATMVARSVLKAVTSLSPIVGDPVEPEGFNLPDSDPATEAEVNAALTAKPESAVTPDQPTTEIQPAAEPANTTPAS